MLETLAPTFPKLQFILTTHSPILVGSLPPENILITERNDEGLGEIRLASEDVYGQAVDKITAAMELADQSREDVAVARAAMELIWPEPG